MFIQPIYNILLLPDVTYYFKKDFFAGRSDDLKSDTDILFALLKNDTENGMLKPDDIYPVGLSAKIENISDEDVVQIRTVDRVKITDPVIEDGEILASFSVLPSVEDMPEEEQEKTFAELRSDLLKFVQGYQWGLWARGFILQRKNIFDLASALSEYLNLTPDDNPRGVIGKADARVTALLEEHVPVQGRLPLTDFAKLYKELFGMRRKQDQLTADITATGQFKVTNCKNRKYISRV